MALPPEWSKVVLSTDEIRIRAIPAFDNMRAVLYPLLLRAWWASTGYPAHRVACLLRESQWWPRRQLEEFRDEKLRRLIEHCYLHVPYYHRMMDERGLKPKDIQSATDLCKLPVLTKEIMRTNWNKLKAQNINYKNTVLVETGGSTGEPMKVLKSVEGGAWPDMCFQRGISWGGLEPGMKYVSLMGGSLGGSKKTWREKMRRRFAGQIALLAYDLRQDNVSEYVDVIRHSRSEFIVGYASVLCYLARMLSEHGDTLNLKAAFTTSESLLPSWANSIRQAMNCKVYDYYGCGECNSLGFQCQEGNTYHISEEHVVLEVESETGQANFAGTGQLLISDLDNYAMPLLRYRNGDYLTIGEGSCPCGRSLRLISKLEGRTSGFLLSATGQLVSGGICDFIMANVHSIDEFQVRQDALGHIRVLLVPRQKVTEADFIYIRNTFRYYLGETVDVETKLVASIPRTAAQKLQTAVNEILNESQS